MNDEKSENARPDKTSNGNIARNSRKNMFLEKPSVEEWHGSQTKKYNPSLRAKQVRRWPI